MQQFTHQKQVTLWPPSQPRASKDTSSTIIEKYKQNAYQCPAQHGLWEIVLRNYTLTLSIHQHNQINGQILGDMNEILTSPLVNPEKLCLSLGRRRSILDCCSIFGPRSISSSAPRRVEIPKRGRLERVLSLFILPFGRFKWEK